MNAERLLALYEKVAEAPEAIARLRRFVLDLAVRGKLVEKDAGDEPAFLLLRTTLAKLSTGERHRRKDDIAARRQDLIFSIPAHWEPLFVSQALQELQTGPFGSSLHKADYRKGGTPVLNPASLQNGIIVPIDDMAVGPATLERLASFKVRAKDILIARRGEMGRCAVVTKKEEGWLCGTGSLILRPSDAIFPEYLAIVISSPTGRAFLAGAAVGTTMQNLNQAILLRMPFGLPPLAEQRRIVAKVEELMALLDRLEAARTAREATRDRLTAASLARLTAADGDPADFPNKARFALTTFPALTARADQIKHLRQTILNLAVRGKLVEQDPADEPLDLPPSNDVACPERLPKRWRYARLINLLAENTRNGFSRRPDDAENGIPILRISAGTVRQDGIVAEEEHKLISGIDAATRFQYGLQRGDLLACRFNGNKAFVGRLTLFNDYLSLDPIYPDKLIRVRLERRLALPEFVRMAGESDLVRGSIEEFCATTVGNWGISASNLKEVPIPLPPLAEQQRIVAKVDTLMAFCDRLEAALATANITRARLLEALLHKALLPTMPRMAAAE